MTGKVWFITGASSGFGRLMTELALRNGDLAVATLRKPEVLADLDDLSSQHGSDKLLRPQEIRDGFSEAIKKFGRVDFVFSNVGYSQIGEVEGVPEDVARAIFETNFWGAVNVSKEAVRVFRDVNKPAGGTLLQLSSAAGIKAYPAIGYYSATKYALEGISTALAAELGPEWNIKVIIVEPGNFATSGISNAVIVPPHPAYTRLTNPAAMMREWAKGDIANAERDAGKAVQAMYEIAQIPDSPLRFPLGKDAIQQVRDQTAGFLADTDLVASWSDGLDVKA
ncbi:NAD(P)-binding protein [Daedalea quercina L-15889]|uniref:NAD(P)-binding protein n=1 Tax=Daedalea quercina L-15889 TaxID=1314783 RepID=A0A165SZT1_9APHY|nr:NAD(P)-binding protein [Daedalea quercina L-15889]